MTGRTLGGRAVRLPGARWWARAAAVRWARSVTAEDSAVVLDCETTGLPRRGAPMPRVVEVAVVDLAGRAVIDTRIDPEMAIPAAATAVHGIGDAEVRGAPPLARVLPALTEAVRGRRVVIFNADFDVSVLGAGVMRQRLGIDTVDERLAVLEGRRWLASTSAFADCAMVRAAAWRAVPGRRGWTRPRLGGDPATAHAAAADCRALVELLGAMAADDRSTALGAVCAHPRQPRPFHSLEAMTSPDETAGRAVWPFRGHLPQTRSER